MSGQEIHQAASIRPLGPVVATLILLFFTRLLPFLPLIGSKSRGHGNVADLIDIL
jgi:hypothetical protein